MFRVVTISAEYGSGAGSIARTIAQELGWNLLDKALVGQIARAARVDPALAQRYDENVDSWLHRVSRRSLWRGALEGIATVAESDIFDAETMAALARKLIEEAYAGCSCVIVGRGAQCVLQDRECAFHVFIYAPWTDRVARVRARFPEGDDAEGLIRSTDEHRREFIRVNFGCYWKDPHLYNMLICSEPGEDFVAEMVVRAVERGGKGCA